MLIYLIVPSLIVKNKSNPLTCGIPLIVELFTQSSQNQELSSFRRQSGLLETVLNGVFVMFRTFYTSIYILWYLYFLELQSMPLIKMVEPYKCRLKFRSVLTNNRLAWTGATEIQSINQHVLRTCKNILYIIKCNFMFVKSFQIFNYYTLLLKIYMFISHIIWKYIKSVKVSCLL